MKKALQRSALALCVLTLAGCGGGDGNQLSNGGGSGGTGGTTDTSAKSLEVSASSRQLGSSGDKPVTISAIAKDANNNILKDATVQFSVNNEATIEAESSTASTGVKTALLTPGLENPENRNVTVTVKAGTLVKKLDIAITGTTLVVDGPARIALNTPTTFTAKLKDSAGKALANEAVTVNSSLNNALTPVSGSGFVTDTNGEVQFQVNAAVSGMDTIAVSALGVNSSKSLEVSGDNFSLSSANSEIKVTTPESISIKWAQNGIAQANRVINIAATRGNITSLQSIPLQTVTTDTQGQAIFSIQSKTAGGTVITATDVNTGLSTSLTREFIATTPAILNMQVEKELITPESSTNIVAVVHDKADNPVKNQVVVFNLEDTVGGKLSSSTATTDSLGKATIGYTAGNATSAKDGVKITSYIQNTTINDDISLTVGGQALRIVLGEDEKIVEDGMFYKKTFGVIVTDSAGNPVKDKKVDFTLIPINYIKGNYKSCNTVTDAITGLPNSKPIYNPQVTCPSEDVDNDGWLDTGEDFNGNKRLDPTHAATVTNSAVTDSEGKVLTTVIYPQSQAGWSQVRLTARILVSGTEYIETTDFVLPVAVSDVGSCDFSPPNATSPYGEAADCSSAN